MGVASLARLFSLKSSLPPILLCCPHKTICTKCMTFCNFLVISHQKAHLVLIYCLLLKTLLTRGCIPTHKIHKDACVGYFMRAILQPLPLRRTFSCYSGFSLPKNATQRELKRAHIVFACRGEYSSALSEKLHICGIFLLLLVEDPGQWAMRGGILDIFSFAHATPVRIKLVGNMIQSLRTFTSSHQHSQEDLEVLHVLPCREVLLTESLCEQASESLTNHMHMQKIPHLLMQPLITRIQKQTAFPSLDYLLPFFYSSPLPTPMQYFSSCTTWLVFPDKIQASYQEIKREERVRVQRSV